MQHSARKHHVVAAVLAVALGLAGFSLAGGVAAAPPRQPATGSATVTGHKNCGPASLAMIIEANNKRPARAAPGSCTSTPSTRSWSIRR